MLPLTTLAAAVWLARILPTGACSSVMLAVHIKFAVGVNAGVTLAVDDADVEGH